MLSSAHTKQLIKLIHVLDCNEFEQSWWIILNKHFNLILLFWSAHAYNIIVWKRYDKLSTFIKLNWFLYRLSEEVLFYFFRAEWAVR